MKYTIVLVLLSLAACACASQPSFLSTLHTVSVLASTVPANGDVNPYGMFVVQQTVGNLIRGHILVSNFNNASNLQGTGSTVVQISPQGHVSLFAEITPKDLAGSCPGGIGLTTALVVLKRGWVLVGSLPTTDGSSATMRSGCIIVLDALGNVHSAATIAHGLVNGPWDSAVKDFGETALLFVTNVLNNHVAGSNDAVVNHGTVVRITLLIPYPVLTHEPGTDYPVAPHPEIVEQVLIASGIGCRGDPAALVVGPTGLALKGSTLFVAHTLNNRVFAIVDALTRTTTAFAGSDVSANGLLNAPLGAIIAPNGNIIVANGNDGKLVEISPCGQQVDFKLVDDTLAPPLAPGAGCLFGLVLAPHGIYFVDDCTNTLNLLH